MTDVPEKVELRAELAANEARVKASRRPWYRRKTSVVGFFVVGIVGLMVAGSLSKKDDGYDPTFAEAAAADPDAFDDEMDDVTPTMACLLSEFGTVTQNLVIVNNSSKLSTYFIEGVIERGDVKVGDLFASSSNVAPGQTALEVATGSVEGEGRVTCRIVDVSRMAS